MANYRRRTGIQARRQLRNRRVLIIAGAALLVVVALLLILLPRGGRPDRAVTNVVEPTAAPEIPEDALVEFASPEPTPEPTAAPAQSGVVADAARAATRPTAAPGFAPVFTKANTEEKIIAITVDDCFQADNLRQIVDKALEYDAKLTIFPIGKNAIKKEQAAILKSAWENGFELENHTFSHSGLFNLSDDAMAEEVYKQQLALSYILGVEYQPHFLRPRGGDARRDQRMQNYALQLGYYGIAHWSVDGGHSDQEIAKGLKPGAIYLFHTTDTDLDKLLRFIPWVAEKGYRMVTLNEMFGYPENEYTELTTPISEHTIPPLQPFELVYITLKKTMYDHSAWLLQERLIELGYLSGEPDGVYGDDCVRAVKAYQKDHGLEQTGVATPEVQKMIYEQG